MSDDLPELFYVDLVDHEGVVMHSYDGLIKHLQRHMDPSIAENVLFFFLNGSRVYGTATEESDWDYTCVTKRATKEARKSLACLKGGDDLVSAAKPFMLTESNVYDMDATLELYGLSTTNVPVGLRFDVSFYELGVWRRLAFEQSILPLEAQFLPSQYVLFKAHDFPTFLIDPPVLKTTASLLGGLKFANARPRLDKDHNLSKAKKLGALGIRYLQFGIQLLESYRNNQGKPQITDWRALKPVWDGLFLAHDPTSYAEFEHIFRPTFKSYDTQIRQIMVYPTLYTVRESFSSIWTALRHTLVKISHVPLLPEKSAQVLPSGISSRAMEVFTSISRGAAGNSVEHRPLEEAVAKYHLIPSISKCNRLLSLSLTCNAPVYEMPFLSELNGMVIELPSWNILISAQAFHLHDLVLLKPILDIDILGDSEANMTEKSLIACLEGDSVQLTELYDGIRVSVFWYGGDWRISTVGGSVDAIERIGLRTTEGRGPPKSTVRETFLNMFCAGNRMLDSLDPNWVYIFDMLTDTARSITANRPERLVLFDSFLAAGASTASSIAPLPPFIEPAASFRTLSQEIESISGWRGRLLRLLAEVEYMNPFEQAGFILRDKFGKPCAKLACRSYWSVKASLGHQNRVLAFNVAADHFESESLLDVSIFGFSREFCATFPSWSAPTQESAKERSSICKLLDAKRLLYFGEKDRKTFANQMQAVEHPFKSILFEWYNFPFASASDILATLDQACVRALRDIIARESSSVVPV